MVVYYASAQDVKDFCKITYVDLGLPNDTAYTTLIEALISIVERIIEDFCGVPSTFFKASGLTITDEYHDSDGSGYLWLKYRPVISVTKLEYNEKALTETASWVELLAGPGMGKNYLLYAEKGLIYVYQEAPGEGYRNIRVTYVAGYTTVPGPVAQACKELVSEWIRKILKNKLTPQEISQSITQGITPSPVVEPGLTKTQRIMLAPYRVSIANVG
jgi:hypothetical protein